MSCKCNDCKCKSKKEFDSYKYLYNKLKIHWNWLKIRDLEEITGFINKLYENIEKEKNKEDLSNT